MSIDDEPEPLRILRVVPDDARYSSRQWDDASGGYRVPVLLSRRPTADEERLLREAWQQPPEYTTMHRRDILSVEGDRVVLRDTTVEEVRDHHAKTLRLVVDQTNRLAAQRRAEQREARARAQTDEEARRRHFDQVAKEIKFGED